MHLDRVAAAVTEHLVHVADARARRQARAFGDLHQRAREHAGHRQLGRERTVADLHVQHKAIQAGSELLRQDARGDQRDRLDRRGHVADRIQASIGWRQRSRLSDDGTAGAAQRGAQLFAGWRRAVARNAFELVERAAGVSQAPARDHRHEAAAGGDDRREQQADLVAHTAGRMLVEHRTAEVRAGPVEHVAGARHRVRQCDGLGVRQAVQEHCHRQRGSLRLAPRRIDEAGDERVDLRPVQRVAVAFAANDFLREHGDLRRFRVPPAALRVFRPEPLRCRSAGCSRRSESAPAAAHRGPAPARTGGGRAPRRRPCGCHPRP